jgi:hypothetical protein
MENTRYGGGACCPYCGKYIFNAGLDMPFDGQNFILTGPEEN